MPDDTLRSIVGSRKPPTLAAHVTQELRDAIIQGEFRPGEQLLLGEIARRLDVSVMPVREALKRLESEGLIEQSPQKEARVARLSLEDLDDTYAARMLLEPRVIRRSAQKFSEEDYQRLSGILESYETAYEAGEDSEGRRLHKAFHFGMYQVGGSVWLLRLISTLWDNSERYRRLSLTQRGTVRDRRREHAEVLEACRANNPNLAATLLKAHLHRTATLVYERAKSLLEDE
ncbi:MAG: GntR family transcriptional regulator [Firmicutes bacterium]|nr:GntR family transcriptional regulator [Bacillota bacterium]